MGYGTVAGNIKQQVLPFVLNSSDTAITDINFTNDTVGAPQLFSFKNIANTQYKSSGQINFCPSSFKRNFDKDISYQLLYNKDNSTYTPTSGQLAFDTILEHIPGIQIREYLPDTALDQVINFFVELFKSVKQLFGGIDLVTMWNTTFDTKLVENTETSKTGEDQTFFKKLTRVSEYIVKFCMGDSQPDNIVISFLKAKSSDGKSFDGKLFDMAHRYKTGTLGVVDFPYMLYYKLQSCTTTTIYELPGVSSDKLLYSADGTPGWGDAAGLSFMDSIPGLKTLSNIPGAGSVIKKMFGNINISFMPWWDATSGNFTSEPTIEISFDLYNDTLNDAIINFIFVNTLVPSARWIQKALFQQSPNIYDIKLHGYNRLFACTGKFQVTYDGILRDPSMQFFETLAAKHLNSNLISDKNTFMRKLRDDRLIKIPDVYKVKMTFDSLLPANLNNYIYSLLANKTAYDEFNDGSQTRHYDNFIMTDGLKNVIKDLFTGAKKAWNGTSQTKNTEATNTEANN